MTLWQATRALAFFVSAALVGLLLVALAHAQPAAPAASSAPDLDIPAWTYCAPLPAGQAPTPTTLAGFSQDGVRQLLRIQEHARYGVRLSDLHDQIEAKTRALIAELEAAQRSYEALRQVITERNTGLSAELVQAQGEAERYRSRAERRRIWPWVSLGFGLLLGGLVGGVVAH